MREIRIAHKNLLKVVEPDKFRMLGDPVPFGQGITYRHDERIIEDGDDGNQNRQREYAKLQFLAPFSP
ncbi:hypothetical protein D3C81_1797380 [compost metagenome]